MSKADISIRITRETQKKLKKIGVFGESYEILIKRLIKTYEEKNNKED